MTAFLSPLRIVWILIPASASIAEMSATCAIAPMEPTSAEELADTLPAWLAIQYAALAPRSSIWAWTGISPAAPNTSSTSSSSPATSPPGEYGRIVGIWYPPRHINTLGNISPTASTAIATSPSPGSGASTSSSRSRSIGSPNSWICQMRIAQPRR